MANNKELNMDNESKRLFKVRRTQKGKKPQFKRSASHKFKRLDSNWRRPRGLQSKLRRHVKAKGSLAQPGYGSPCQVKGLHPSGYQDILVHTPKEVEDIDPTTQAIRIAKSVGGRKRAIIIEKAEELGIKVLNHNARGGDEE
ncbi:50S ribosomal protein L32e [Methanosalsum natronophilum]|nr:50S ribosomal protein L32e [Methanosalsum natronophilum]MCS3924757.1 large subunit ribosomal protein L32e [Methanosalsum natronophilum]